MVVTLMIPGQNRTEGDTKINIPVEEESPKSLSPAQGSVIRITYSSNGKSENG